MFYSALRTQFSRAMAELEALRALYEQERSARQRLEALVPELRKQLEAAEERAARFEKNYVDATLSHSRTLEGVILSNAGIEPTLPTRVASGEQREVKPPPSPTTPFRRLQHSLIREAVKDLKNSAIKEITKTVQ